MNIDRFSYAELCWQLMNNEDKARREEARFRHTMQTLDEENRAIFAEIRRRLARYEVRVLSTEIEEREALAEYLQERFEQEQLHRIHELQHEPNRTDEQYCTLWAFADRRVDLACEWAAQQGWSDPNAIREMQWEAIVEERRRVEGA